MADLNWKTLGNINRQNILVKRQKFENKPSQVLPIRNSPETKGLHIADRVKVTQSAAGCLHFQFPWHLDLLDPGGPLTL